ncbi:MAG: hypothetical protein QXO71_03715 [Candidatus Jordarchaeaceae archaeon]
MNQEEKLKAEFIHFCIKCGTQLNLEQETLPCSKCGSTTFKLKKIYRGTRAEEREETKGEACLSALSGIIANGKLGVGEERLETVKVEGIGIFNIDGEGLMSGKPLILSCKEGVYEIFVQKLMERVKR